MSEVHKARIDGLRELMKKEGVDYYVEFTSDSHMSEYIDDYYKFRDYLTGFTGSSGIFLAGMEEAILWTDGRYYLQAEKELEGSGVLLYKMEEDVDDLYEYLRKNGRGKTLGVDGSHISQYTYEKLIGVMGDEKCINNNIDFSEELWTDRPAKNRQRVKLLSESIAGRNINDKTEEVRKKYMALGADACLIADLADIMWLFNIRGSDIEFSPLAYSYAFVTKSQSILYLDRNAACNELYAAMSIYGNIIRPYEDIYTKLNFPKGTKIVCDKKRINSKVYALLSEDNIMIDEDHTRLINKSVKNKAEIKNARKYHILDARTVTSWIFEIKRRVKAGEKITEYQAGQRVDELRADIKGSMGPSFNTICAYGKNAAVIHYAPDKTKSSVLKPEGFLLLDSGGQYNGATTDITRTIALGRLTEEMREDYTAVLRAHLRLMSLIFLRGCRGENLDIIAREPIWERYIDYKHGTGHGVGSFLSVHEGPQAIRYRIKDDDPQPEFEPGMITSDEPGIYIKGRYGIRTENLLLCTEKKRNEWGVFLGFESLTLVPYEREAIIPERLDKKERDTLNSYHELVYETLKDDLEAGDAELLREACAPV